MTRTQNHANPVSAAAGDTREGYFYALSAYILWGGLPFYMKAVAHIPPAEVVAHRILWSVPLAGIILLWLGRTSDVHAALRSPKALAQSGLAAAFITVNWGIYVWAIGAGRALETALGYYINPLFSIFLGAVLLGERLSRTQIVAIVLAAIAVGVLAVEAGGVPVVAVGLTLSWGCYAFLKRTLPIGPAQGFFLEVLLLTPLALAFVAWLAAFGQGHFAVGNSYDTTMLACAGFVTAIPLILYANGAKGLRLSTIGILQYIAPTLIFLVAVFVFGEPFSSYKAVAFALIWTALVVYTVELLRISRAATQ